MYTMLSAQWPSWSSSPCASWCQDLSPWAFSVLSLFLGQLADVQGLGFTAATAAFDGLAYEEALHKSRDLGNQKFEFNCKVL